MTTSQTWDPERYARNARYVADLAMPVVELLAPRPGERILGLLRFAATKPQSHNHA